MSSEKRRTQAFQKDLIDTVLADRYRILDKLGEGGMGTVYLAEHTTIGKQIAVKVLAPEYSHRQDLVHRFLQEARAASRIQQENVVEITDFGETPDGSVFLAMEYLKGDDLATILRRDGPLAWSRAKGMIVQICRALAAAHDAKIIHRDMKPENCFRIQRASNHDFIKVLDFGIAKVLQDDDAEDGQNMEVEEVGDAQRPRGLTRTGVILGTPEYMSPEQASGIDIDHRADIYAVGVIMYELLTGHVPFSGKTFMAILQSHMFDSPRPPSRVSPYADIPPEAEAIILKSLQKDREFRFQSMRELITAIEQVGTGAPAVSVIDERPTLPSQGAMQYLGTGPRDALYPERPTAVVEPTRITRDSQIVQKRGNAPLLVAALGVLALVGGVGAYLALAGDGAPASGPTVAADPSATPEPVQLVVPTPTPTPTPTMSEKIGLSITTPVVAQVRDAEDGSVFGVTNGEPIEFTRGDEPVKLVLSAQGYDELEIEFTPNANLQVERLLEKTGAGKGGKGGKGGKKGGKGGKGGKGDKPTPEKTTDAPANDGKTKPDKGNDKATYESPDLLNPFGKKKK